MASPNANFEGLLLATAAADALGLPREGLSRRRAARLFHAPTLRHALLGPFGLTSDDTEHAILTAQALLSSNGDPARFARALASRLRLWFIFLPPGTGLATARACIKLLFGFPPSHSGVHSAGNGPAMRAPIIGAYARSNLPLLRNLIRISTCLTHTDPAAEHGALAIALALAVHDPTPNAYLALVRRELPNTPMLALLESACAALTAGQSFDDHLTAANLSQGISGYINHTVPAVIFCWLQYPTKLRPAVEQIITAGGDTDTTAALLAALIAARTGPSAIPADWLTNLKDFPHTKPWLRRLGASLSSVPPGPSPPIFWPAIPFRNLLLLLIVLVHGLRRLLPPY